MIPDSYDGITTSECLARFLEKYSWGPVQAFVAKFADVEKGTVRRWKNGSMPKGGELLSVRVMLHLAGYGVEEFKSLPPPSQQFAIAIVLGLIGKDEATDMLGYANVRELFRVLLRGSGLMRNRAWRMESYVEGSEEDIQQATAAFRRELEMLPLESAPFRPPDQADVHSGSGGQGKEMLVEDDVSPRRLLEEGLAFAMRSAASLSQALFSDGYEASELQRVIPSGELEAILGHLNRLSNPKD